jgi:hypothetical protein
MNSVEGDQFADPVLDSELEREGQVLKPVGVETSNLCEGDFLMFWVLGEQFGLGGWRPSRHFK